MIFLLRKRTFNIIDEFPLKNGTYPVKFKSEKKIYQAYSVKPNSVDQLHRKIGHIHPNRRHQLSLQNRDIPQFSRVELSNHQCVPWISDKERRASIISSTRYTTRHLELIHLDISGPIERSLQSFQYTVAILDDFTAKSDAYFLKAKSGLLSIL